MTEVDDFLLHYGVKGMKWGKVQAKSKTESLETKLPNGNVLTLSGDKTPPIARYLSKVIPKYAESLNKHSNYTLKDSLGETIGELSLVKKGPKELNVIWVEVDESQRGKGYAKAAMNASIEFAKKEKLEKVTLEVPGISPDARHIYEQLGFSAGKQITPKTDIWGGLTSMELDLRRHHD